MANPGTLHDWVEDLPARGRYTFSRAEALCATDASPAAVKQTLYRLKKRKAIVSPRRDFNPATAKYDFRVFLLKLGLICDEFKTARLHLLARLNGSTAWKGERRDTAAYREANG